MDNQIKFRKLSELPVYSINPEYINKNGEVKQNHFLKSLIRNNGKRRQEFIITKNNHVSFYRGDYFLRVSESEVLHLSVKTFVEKSDHVKLIKIS